MESLTTNTLMNKKTYPKIAGSLVLLAIIFVSFEASAQIPKQFVKFIEAQNRVKSGYVKFQNLSITNDDTVAIEIHDVFFISTAKDLQYLTYLQRPNNTQIYCKAVHTEMKFFSWKNIEEVVYRIDDEIDDAKHDVYFPNIAYSTAHGFSLEEFENCQFQQITPKLNKKNIRYRIKYPDDDVSSDKFLEYEFDRDRLHWTQEEGGEIFLLTDKGYFRTDILEQRLYDYIHPDILDTINFKFEELRRGYDKQCAIEQAIKDSLLIDSITRKAYSSKWVETLSQEDQKDTLFYMPEWKFPLLTGDTIYSNRINSRFLLIDMWYIACHPCRLVMRDLATIDTLYDESLLKMISINIGDMDTAKIKKVIQDVGIKCDVACVFENYSEIADLSKKMGGCEGFPQLYLVDMQTKQVVWRSCGWYEGFTKDIEEVLK